jgi:hypothetical protein
VRAFLLLLVLALPAWAQDKPAAPKKKPAASKQAPVAHKKPTPEQIRKFNQLEKKQAPEPKKK